MLGEKFTVYRGESGEAHVVEYRCAHRACPLFLGWVEGDAIRCRYHGWKFDASGQCIEQPAEEKSFAHRIKVRAYPTQEYAGLIFAYLGDGAPPPFRRYPDLDRPGVIITDPVEVLPCSLWNRQDNDHSHIPWVHRATAIRKNRPDLLVHRHEDVEETPYGWMGTRSVPGERKDAERVLGMGRLTHYFMPNVRLFWAPTRAKGFEGRGLVGHQGGVDGAGERRLARGVRRHPHAGGGRGGESVRGKPRRRRSRRPRSAGTSRRRCWPAR